MSLVFFVVGAAACSRGPKLSPEAERGRRAYFTYCVACHNSDPSRDGAVGPAVRGASRDLIEARVLRAAYPPGYAPKRATKAMLPIPQAADRVDDLAAFLR